MYTLYRQFLSLYFLFLTWYHPWQKMEKSGTFQQIRSTVVGTLCLRIPLHASAMCPSLQYNISFAKLTRLNYIISKQDSAILQYPQKALPGVRASVSIKWLGVHKSVCELPSLT